MNQTLLQPIWDWMLRHLGVGFFEFPLYFLPVVVAVVLVTGIVYSIFDVAVYHRISAKAAANSGSGSPRIMSVRRWCSSSCTASSTLGGRSPNGRTDGRCVRHAAGGLHGDRRVPHLLVAPPRAR